MHLPTRDSTAGETWLDLEKLAATIYAELEPSCTVEHDVKLRGVISETDRQIDVLIRSIETGSLVVVDCKDRNRRVNVADAWAFAGVLEDVEATSGVLICNRGFSKAARTVAVKKGFSLCQLHDAASRKWRLDVLVPVVWTSLFITHLDIQMKVHLEAQDSIPTRAAPTFKVDGKRIDPVQFFVEGWNTGQMHVRRPGQYSATMRADLVTLDDQIRPDAQVQIDYAVGGGSKLGYFTPQDSRGILDVESGAYQTVTLDFGKTLNQEPASEWREIHDPDELAITYKGTVVGVDQVANLEARWDRIKAIRYLGPGEGN